LVDATIGQSRQCQTSTHDHKHTRSPSRDEAAYFLFYLFRGDVHARRAKPRAHEQCRRTQAHAGTFAHTVERAASPAFARCASTPTRDSPSFGRARHEGRCKYTAALTAVQLVYAGEECIITEKGGTGAGAYSSFSSTDADAGWRRGFDLHAPISDLHWQH
jgi:hypothetical protein